MGGSDLLKAAVTGILLILTLILLDLCLPMTDPEENKTSASPLNVALTQGRRALWKGNPPALFGRLLNPLRTYVFDPLLAISSVLMPLFMPSRIERIIARLFNATLLPVIGLMYEKKTQHGVNSSAKHEILHRPSIAPIKPPSDSYSAFMAAVSFTCSAIQDIASLVTNPKKYQGWIGALTQFNNFLQETGIGDEMYEAIQKPLLSGRLICNFKILNDIQEQENANRLKLAQKETITKEYLKEQTEVGRDIMRFATAAYGTEMIRSAVDRHVDSPEVFESHKDSIVFHALNKDKGEVAFVCSDDAKSFDKHVLHHFAAVNHTRKAVILAIRGTLSLSGAIIGIQGMAVDFCTGKAHEGIAEMADNLWKCSGGEVIKLMNDFPNYKLIITGHSLGAGTACLLNMQLHVNEVFKGRTVQCFAFAPPPTFWPCADDSDPEECDAKVKQAMQNTTAYIHDNDVVPFLSVTAVRRMVNLLDSVDNKTELIWFWKRWQIFQDFAKIPADISDSVSKAEASQDLADGECRMTIPAHCVVWCKENEDGKFEGYACDPYKVADTDVFLCPDMVSDHLPEEYEDCLDALVETWLKDM